MAKKRPTETLLTVAEASHYRRTSTHREVQDFCRALSDRSPLVHLTEIGTSGEGQPITALIVSDKRAFTPELARKQKKVVVLIEANIHAGEVEGKEASLALVRDLTSDPKHKELWSKVCLVLVPNFNPDGNDRISPKNRALDLANLEGQVNPEEGVGMRYTGEGWNLNRDSMKQEAPETRAMAKAYQRFWPHLFIDCHTTDGSLHRYDLTYDCPRSNNAMFAPVRALNHALLASVSASVEKSHHFKSQWYGNFVREAEPESGWHTYPALPRFGSHYRGLHGRLDVLLETYSYISYARRCETTRAWLFELLRYAARNAQKIQAVLAEQEKQSLTRAPDPRTRVELGYGVAKRDGKGALIFDYPAYALAGDALKILSFDRESLSARRYPGKKQATYTVPHLRGFVATESARLPFAYLVPSTLASRLEGHGITFQKLASDQRFDVESYVIVAKEETFSPDVAANVPQKGEAEVPLSQKPSPVRFETVLSVRAERRELTAQAGMLLVPTAQRSGVLASYLLEPHSDDGFTRWQFLDSDLAVGGIYPIHRLLTHVTPRTRPE
jgi:Zinc carboxypeptidase